MWAWTDNQENPEEALTLDEMLDNIMLYWLPGNATSSARLYWESVANVAPTNLANVASTRLELPVGVSIYTARDQPPLAALGRSADARPDPLQYPGPGGPLCRLGAASAARQGDSRLLRQGCADLGKLICRIGI